MPIRIPLGRKLQGLLAASPVALLAVILLWIAMLGAFYAVVAPAPGAGPRGIPWRELRSFVIEVGVIAGYGLPIALVAVLALGLPAWLLAERLGWHSRRAAARLGMAIGLLVFLIPFSDTLHGMMHAREEGSQFFSGMWGSDIEVNGWPTPLGWAIQAAMALVLAATGAITGAAAHAVATRGPR